MKGIYFSNGRYGIRWWDSVQKKMIHGGRFGTEQEAITALQEHLAESVSDEAAVEFPIIRAVDPNKYDPAQADKMWEAAATAHDDYKQTADHRKKQYIHLESKPTGIAFLSDLHIGNIGTDYSAILKDTMLIRDTPGMYAAFHGDGIDNWIVSKLQGLQRNQAVSFHAEIAMFRRWLELIHEKLLLVVSGNHDNWTTKLSGIDIIPSLLGQTHVIYDPFEAQVTITCGSAHWETLVRHKWKHSSIFNPTHGIEVGFDRLTAPFDIGVGGHTHIGTLLRPFIKHGKERLAVLTGAYKRIDAFSKEIGYAETASTGCGAIIFLPDGRLWYNSDLKLACEYLTYLRGR
jgi:hypothetical protein